MPQVPPERLSHELREETSPDLRRRRWVIGLSMVGTAAAQLVALYQTGILKRLPDPPVGPFDSERVDASSYAYKRLQTPDGFLMLGSYAVTGALAAAGGKDRATEQPWLPIAAAAKTLYDAATTVRLGREESLKLRDNRYESDALAEQAGLLDDHEGPFYVECQEAIREHTDGGIVAAIEREFPGQVKHVLGAWP